MIWLATTAVKVLALLIYQIPRPMQLWMGRRLGDFWYYVLRLRTDVVIENIQKAFPDWDRERVLKTARANFQNYGCSLIEFLMLPKLTAKDLQALFILEGMENYHSAMAQNKGAFLMTLHMGNWELMSVAGRSAGIPLHVITKRFKAEILNEIWVNLRLDHGIKLIKEEKTTFEILRAIRKGDAVGFILDQFMGPPVGVRTKFFGIETGTQAGLALFADRTRAPVVPSYNIRLPDGRFKLVFEPEIPFMEQGVTDKNIAFMTQAYTNKIEEIVRKYPEQWMWLHRRWKPFRE